MSDTLARILDDKRALVADRKRARPLSAVEADARAAVTGPVLLKAFIVDP